MTYSGSSIEDVHDGVGAVRPSARHLIGFAVLLLAPLSAQRGVAAQLLQPVALLADERSDGRIDDPRLQLVERLRCQPLLADGGNQQQRAAHRPERHELPELYDQLHDHHH